MSIIHIIYRDKFTQGYIKFMLSQFIEYNHCFFTLFGKDEVCVPENGVLYELKSLKTVTEEKKYRQLLENADTIIVSGVFRIPTSVIFLFLRKGIIKKTFFHFWGGDFYVFREAPKSIKQYVSRKVFYYGFHKAAGLLFLFNGEYEVFRSITHISNKHFIAPMPGDPAKVIDYAALRAGQEKDKGTINIIIGNSANPTNHHLEVFEKLKNFIEESINIFVPLSYGGEKNAEAVAKRGYELFGDKFYPIFKFMDSDSYMKFLSTMDIGIFNNDRQQGMGNIANLMRLGKKVYLRKGTSMWDEFRRRGYTLFDIETITDMTLADFCYFGDDDRSNNIQIADLSYRNRTINNRKAWSVILCSNEELKN